MRGTTLSRRDGGQHPYTCDYEVRVILSVSGVMAGRLGMLIRAPSLSTYGADKFIDPFRDLIGLI